MSLNKEQLKEFEELLRAREKEIRAELSDFSHENKEAKEEDFVSNFPNYGDSEDDNAQEIAAYGDRLGVEGTLEKELRDIESSLKRIGDGTYGVCKYCGKDIGEARLKIRPSSSSCVECKKKFKGEK